MLTFVDMKTERIDFMKYSRFKKFAKRKDVHMLIDLDTLEQFKDGQTILVKDKRTVKKGDGYEVEPIAVTNSHMYVVCPFCGHIHKHGLPDAILEEDVLPSGDFCGTRESHCHKSIYDIYLIIV